MANKHSILIIIKVLEGGGCGGARGVMVIVVEKGYGDKSSNPR